MSKIPILSIVAVLIAVYLIITAVIFALNWSLLQILTSTISAKKQLGLSLKRYLYIGLFLFSGLANAMYDEVIKVYKSGDYKVALAEYIWSDYVDEAQSFDFLFSQIKNLKRKLKEAGAEVKIDNIYGVGYQIKPA